MQGFLRKISPPLIFLLGALLAVIFEHTIFGPAALEYQTPSLSLLFLCISLFFTADSFWFWYFRIFTTGFLIEMTSSTFPGLKLILVFFCGTLFRHFLALINFKSAVLFICFFSTFFLIVEGVSLAICSLIEHTALFSIYALGLRLIYNILLTIPLFYIYERLKA